MPCMSRGIALPFFNLSTRCGWAVNTTLRPLCPRKRPGTHCIRGWMGPRAGIDWYGNFALIGVRTPDRPARSESLYRLHYPGDGGAVFHILSRYYILLIIYQQQIQKRIIRLEIQQETC